MHGAVWWPVLLLHNASCSNHYSILPQIWTIGQINMDFVSLFQTTLPLISLFHRLPPSSYFLWKRNLLHSIFHRFSFTIIIITVSFSSLLNLNSRPEKSMHDNHIWLTYIYGHLATSTACCQCPGGGIKMIFWLIFYELCYAQYFSFFVSLVAMLSFKPVTPIEKAGETMNVW